MCGREYPEEYAFSDAERAYMQAAGSPGTLQRALLAAAAAARGPVGIGRAMPHTGSSGSKWQPRLAVGNTQYSLPMVYSEQAAMDVRDVGMALLRRGLLELG